MAGVARLGPQHLKPRLANKLQQQPPQLNQQPKNLKFARFSTALLNLVRQAFVFCCDSEFDLIRICHKPQHFG
jgi:hypothetical protein